jgi:hypothetical protein
MWAGIMLHNGQPRWAPGLIRRAIGLGDFMTDRFRVGGGAGVAKDVTFRPNFKRTAQS